MHGCLGEEDRRAMMNKWDLSMFGLEDLYSVAVAVERGGYDLYSYLTEHSTNAKIKSEMQFLREEEAKHENFFRSQITKKGKVPPGVIDPKLMTFIDTEFLTPIRVIFQNKKLEDKAQAFQFALEVEQKTIDFYSAIRKDQSDFDLLADLDTIIQEEESHKRKLLVIMAY